MPSGGNPTDGVKYPRDVCVEQGMPSGWKGIEKQYGPNSKTAGQVYTRYFSLDGVHRNVCSPKQVIELDCRDKGLDPAPVIEDYLRLMKERHEAELIARAKEREASGKLTGEERETAINNFRERFGPLKGPIVYQFPGWTTRWEYMPTSTQTHVTYVDTEGREWKLLKDLECAFQVMLDKGTHPGLPAMIEEGQRLADPEEFAEGSRTAREVAGVFEKTPGTGESRIMSQEDREQRLQIKKIERSKEHQLKSLGRKKRYVSQADYVQSDLQVVDAGIEATKLQAILKSVGLSQSESESMVKSVEDVSEFLSKRGFDICKQLVIVLCRSSHPFLDVCSGMYYRMEETFNERPFFRRVQESPEYKHRFVCCPHHIFWSSSGYWKIGGPLRDDNAGAARCSDNVDSPVDCKLWRLYGAGSGDQMRERDTSAQSQVSLPSQSKDSSQVPATASSAKVEPQVLAKNDVKKDLPKEQPNEPPPSVPKALPYSAKRPRDDPDVDGGIVEDHFHKVWSYNECHGPGVRFGHQMTEVPSHWPPDVEIFPGRWYGWLPQDWGHGVKKKMTDKGGECFVFISPTGSLKYGKDTVEKEVGHALEDNGPPAWPDFVPQDWGLSKMEKPDGTLISIYLPEGWEYGTSRFFDQNRKCLAYQSGGLKANSKSKYLRLLHPDNVGQGEPALKQHKADHDNGSEKVTAS